MEMNLEKNHRKFSFFFLSKFDFEKKMKNFQNFFIFSMENLDFSYKIFIREIEIFHWKNEKFSENISTFFENIFFLHEKLKIFDEIFF